MSSSQEFLWVAPQKKIKTLCTLDQEKTGELGVSFALGGQLTLSLKSSVLSESKSINIKLSDGATELIKDSKEQFLSGLIQTSNSLKPLPEDFTPVTFNVDGAFAKEQIDFANNYTSAIFTAHSLVNTPPNYLNPKTYEDFARQVVAELNQKHSATGSVSVEVFNDEQLRKEGANLITAVGQGAVHKARIIKLHWQPKKNDGLKNITLVGKGITYDTGGLNIKGGNFMRNMKKDMGGSAAVFGTFVGAVDLNLDVNLTVYLAVAENSVDAHSMRPGDVYTGKNGRSIEIDNTDAEGRLALADALCYASEENPDYLINVATLTGAARVALGPMVDCLYSNSKELRQSLFDSGVETADWVWPMPVVSAYRPNVESSTVADSTNSSSMPLAGSVTATLFLESFIEEGTKWAHVDTFMWTDRANLLCDQSGPCPKMVRLLLHTLVKLGKE